MIYEYSCGVCEKRLDLTMSVAAYEASRIAGEPKCCGRKMNQRFSPPRVFVRSPFPKGFSEHISQDGHYIRDRKEAIAVAEENGFVSKIAENWR